MGNIGKPESANYGPLVPPGQDHALSQYIGRIALFFLFSRLLSSLTLFVVIYISKQNTKEGRELQGPTCQETKEKW